MCPIREAAKRNGDKYYYTGRFCQNGHKDRRLTSNGKCLSCYRPIASRSERERRAANKQATPAWANLDAIHAVYEEMRTRNKRSKDKTKWVVDHYYPIRGETVCGLHVAENLQIVTRSYNSSKGNKNPEWND